MAGSFTFFAFFACDGLNITIMASKTSKIQPGSAGGGELKIEDCKLNIYGCRSRSAGACAACRSVFFLIAAPKADLKYSIIKSQRKYPNPIFWRKMHEFNF